MRVALSSPLILASHNAGKLKEFVTLMAPLGLNITSAAAMDLAEPEETGLTFEENALLKAHAAAQATGLTALSDDSGLCVPGLDDAPGIYSARWAGEKKNFSLAMQRIANELAERGIEAQGAAAYFVCVLALADKDGNHFTLRGEVHGMLNFPQRGSHGFGYDPIFIANGQQQTFGEMEPAAKHAISHRAKAFAALSDYLKKAQAA